MPADIVVAGAGIGGLTAALALARGGHRVAVHERAAALEETGAGIQLSPNAARLLARLGLEPALARSWVEPEALVIRRGRDGRLLATLPLSGARRRWGAAYAVIHRADLQRVLLDALQAEPLATLTLGSRVAGVRDEGGVLRVTTETAERPVDLAASLLVGADGLRSSLRTTTGAPDGLAFAGRRAWRRVLEMAQVQAPSRARVSTLWLGRGAHLVHYPVRSGAALNLVAVTDEAGKAPLSHGWSEPREARELQTRFAGWCDEVRTLLEAASAEPDGSAETGGMGDGADDPARTAWRTWPLFDRPGPPAMGSGRIALVGDAAHPMLPFIAQGGAMAIEDAATLARCVSAASDAASAVADYAARRARRAERVQREARLNAERYHWGPPFSLARDAMLMARSGEALLARYDWLYGFDAETGLA